MIDSHCHIHSSAFELDGDVIIAESKAAGVTKFVCVGTDVDDSRGAVAFAATRAEVWASVGIHPHEAKKESARIGEINKLASRDRVVAIGECGLDYWYEYSPRDIQKRIFEKQLKIGLKHDLPFIFHIRGSKSDPNDAFVDFFKIVEKYENIRGVVHSFSAGHDQLKGVLSKSLKVGVNGIATFSQDQSMLRALTVMPSGVFMLETDTPYLTPVPKRGKVNSPKYMGYTAKFLAELRETTVADIETSTTRTAEQLFGI